MTILVFSTVLVYYPSLKVPFLLDDYGKIINNPDIKNLKNISSRLIYPYESPPAWRRNDPSRPLTYLTLTLNYHFNQLEPYGYHVINIALHVLVVLLVFILATLVLPLSGVSEKTPSFLSALIFAIHPINTNVVSYIVGRAASLAAIFYMSAVILFIQARRGFRWGIVVSVVCFIFALASNQLVLTLPAVILVTDFCFFSNGDARRVIERWKQHGIYWGILTLYLGLRMAYFGKLGDLEATSQVFDRTEYFLTQWVILLKYAGLTFLPLGLSFEHLFGPLKYLTDPRVLTATALYGILWVGIRRTLKSSWRSASFGLYGVLWFLITLSPTSSVFPTTAMMAENRVYLPSIGLCLIIPFIGNALIGRVTSERSRNSIMAVVFGIYILFLGYVTVRRNTMYQDPVNIWKDVIRRYPDHERARKNLGIEYLKRGRYSEAVGEYEKLVAMSPSDFDARNNLAMVYYNMKHYREALGIFQKIVREKPDFAAAFANIGLVYEALHDDKAAIKAYQEAIRLNPNLIEPLNNLASLYFVHGHLSEAAKMYESALRIDPGNSQIRKNYELIHPSK